MPRHENTSECASGLGSKVATKQKVKAGKSNIWNPSVCYVPEESSIVTSSPPLCAVEFMRMNTNNWLRKQLRKLRKNHKNEQENNDDNDEGSLKHAVMAVERWFMRYSLHHSENKDPVIPMPTSTMVIDNGFVDDLIKTGGDTPEVAHQVVTAFYKLCRKSADDIQKKNKQQCSIGAVETVVVVKHRHSCDVMLAKNKEKLLKINPDHYEKLKIMFAQSSTSSKFDVAEFHRRLFCVLARYHSIQGHGFQAALTEHVFEVLHKNFGVELECFASPLNTRYSLHCSAFPDTDACFGSLGSFFNFYPTHGSFEANPPFEPTVMLAMAKHINVLLSKATGALSFIVVVPGWKECEAFQLLKASPWNQRAVPIAQADHGFCDGAAHQRRDRYRISPYDTFFFFLQNDAAALKWPVSETAVDELREAMASGVPSPQMQSRHDKAGRGTDDVARGVYKGKKRKATGEGVMKRKQDETRLKNGAKKQQRNT